MTAPQLPNSFRTGPDDRGHFGIFGGRYVAETLMPLILELEKAYEEAKADPAFAAELSALSTHYAGRPSKLYFAEGLTRHLGGARIFFEREDLNHTGSHNVNNCLGQILLARRMGKTRISLRRLHGRYRRAAPGAERFPHEASRRRSRPGDRRQRHAQGRDERGAA